MKTTFAHGLSLVALLAFSLNPLQAADEQSLIETLQSAASAEQKWAACQQLRRVGTAKAVPALAALLTDERTSQAARHALESLPGPEAGAALQQALGKTSGLLKAGVIDSLGWRAESSSVAWLAPLLSDADGAVASAAAAALGRIGGPDAVAALTAARDQAPAVVRLAVSESLLQCAERLLASNDKPGAAAIYRGLVDARFPAQVRTAAWRGLVLSAPAERVDLVIKALGGTDRPLQVAAMKLVRELGDRSVIDAAVAQWASLPAESQLAVLESQVALGAEALSTVRAASQSSDVVLRTAAWQAMGELSDINSVAALAKAAAGGDPSEQEAARESLARLRGPGAREALLVFLESAPAPEKAEVLRAFGERDDRSAVTVLLQSANSQSSPVRLAALESLTRLAPTEAISPLLDIAAKSRSDDERDPVLKALYAVCEASPDKNQTAHDIVTALERFSASERRQMLPLLSEMATPDALAAAQKASRNADSELAKEAVRVLSQWPNAAPAEDLLDLARAGGNATVQTLALRGAIQVIGQEPDAAKRFEFLRRAFNVARQADEKKQALGQIGQVPTPEALELALENMENPDLAGEACLAAIAIVEKLAPANPKLGDQVATKVLAQVKEGDLVRRAWALRLKPSSGASFIRDWVVCGPYRQAGIVGAMAVFDIAFGPEKAGQKVEWLTVSPADSVNLAALFPGAENCAAYLRTHVLAARDCSGALLMGSDDGIKAWLNGELVHSNNVDRGQVVDQDAAPIKLKKGVNELVLKVTQGGGGWSACARIVGEDGKPIPDLMVERPTEPAQALRNRPTRQ